MYDQPLQPFSTPTSLGSFIPSGISVGVLIKWILYIAIIFWVIYTIIAIYHWLKYSHGSWVAFPAIATHLGVSFVLIIFALYGVFTI
jgi:hypothetical protein